MHVPLVVLFAAEGGGRRGSRASSNQLDLGPTIAEVFGVLGRADRTSEFPGAEPAPCRGRAGRRGSSRAPSGTARLRAAGRSVEAHLRHPHRRGSRCTTLQADPRERPATAPPRSRSPPRTTARRCRRRSHGSRAGRWPRGRTRPAMTREQCENLKTLGYVVRERRLLEAALVRRRVSPSVLVLERVDVRYQTRGTRWPTTRREYPPISRHRSRPSWTGPWRRRPRSPACSSRGSAISPTPTRRRFRSSDSSSRCPTIRTSSAPSTPISPTGRAHEILGVIFEPYSRGGLAELLVQRGGRGPQPAPGRIRERQPRGRRSFPASKAASTSSPGARRPAGRFRPGGPTSGAPSGPTCRSKSWRRSARRGRRTPRRPAPAHARAERLSRGRVLSLYVDEMHAMRVAFHRLGRVERDAIVLPDGLLERVERQTTGFSKHAERLRAMGPRLPARDAAVRASRHGRDLPDPVRDQRHGGPEPCSS